MQVIANIQVQDMKQYSWLAGPAGVSQAKAWQDVLPLTILQDQLNQTVMGSRCPRGTFKIEMHRRKSIYVDSSHRLTTFCDSVFHIIFSGTLGIFCNKKPQNFFGFSPGIKVKKQYRNKVQNIRRNPAGIFLYSILKKVKTIFPVI